MGKLRPHLDHRPEVGEVEEGRLVGEALLLFVGVVLSLSWCIWLMRLSRGKKSTKDGHWIMDGQVRGLCPVLQIENVGSVGSLPKFLGRPA